MANILQWLSQHLVVIVIIAVTISLIAGFFVWLRRDAFLKEKLRESLFRNIGVPHRNLIGLLLGSIAAILLMSAYKLDPGWIALIFVVALAATILLLIFVRPNEERKVDRFAWGLLVIIVLGFGLGALIYQYREWWKWLWRQYRRINTPDEFILESLFLLGVILGVYVVRNWAKDQKAFQESLSGALAGTFVATVLGKLQEGLTPLRAFAYYGLGFTMSATVNLVLAGRLTANYVNKRSITSRALLDFLYGSERARIIDGYFLVNFEEDKDYAKKQLTETLIEYRKLVAREFAERMEKRRKSRAAKRKEFRNPDAITAARVAIQQEMEELTSPPEGPQDERRLKELEGKLRKPIELSPPHQSEGLADQGKKADEEQVAMTIEILEERRIQLEPACSQLKATRDELKRLRSEKKSATSAPEPKSKKQQLRLKQIETELTKLECHERELKSNTRIEEQLVEWSKLEGVLGHLKPSYFYWLIAIECEEKADGESELNPGVPPKERLYDVVYKYIGTDEAWADLEHSHVISVSEEAPVIDEKMFRVGVGIRRGDLLDYVVAPGEYRKSFPVFGSVAGLALMFKQTIIMDRDMRRTFREKDHNICPKDIEQDRGLDEVDFLSYISIPVVNPQGDPAAGGLAVVNIDTKLFVTRSQLHGEPVKACEGIFRTRLTPRQLTDFASNLYEQDDEDVKYIEEVTRIITPVVVLYAKCLVGAT